MVLPDTVNSGVTITDSDGISVTGGTLVDTITFTTAIAATTVTGGTGADTIQLGNFTNTLSINDVDGISVTGGSGVDTITNTAGIDTIIGGGAADSLTGGTGVDTFKWTATTAALFATETGSTAGTNVTFTAGTIGDSIVGFLSATDKLHFAAAGVTNAVGTETDTLGSIVKAGTVTNVMRFVHITDTVVGDAVNTGAGAVAVLNALTTTAVAIGDSFIAAMDNDTNTYLYYVKQVSAADTIAAQDVTLIGMLSGITTVANGDFVSF